MPLVEVCEVADLQDSTPKIVKVGQREIVIVMRHGEIFALRNVCPHQSQSFDCGTVRGAITGPEVGVVGVDEDDPFLICPWHTWPFSLRTGKCAVDPKLAIKRYTATIDNGKVFVEP